MSAPHCVIALPSAIVCSACGLLMYAGRYRHGVDHVIVTCLSNGCGQKDVRHKFMLTLTPVEREEPPPAVPAEPYQT